MRARTTPPQERQEPGPEAVEPPLGGPLERWISRILLGGVLLAAAIILLGLARLLTTAPQEGAPATAAALLQQETHPTSLSAILDGVSEGRPTSLVRFGVLVLILTPVARVALTVVLFLKGIGRSSLSPPSSWCCSCWDSWVCWREGRAPRLT